jgi:hypothetical protein
MFLPTHTLDLLSVLRRMLGKVFFQCEKKNVRVKKYKTWVIGSIDNLNNMRKARTKNKLMKRWQQKKKSKEPDFSLSRLLNNSILKGETIKKN